MGVVNLLKILQKFEKLVKQKESVQSVETCRNNKIYTRLHSSISPDFVLTFRLYTKSAYQSI